MQLNAVIYIRVSTDEQRESAAAQESEGRRFAERHGWSVVEVYRDVGVSGAEFIDRPELARLLADVRRKPRPWEIAIVRDLDRIGRDGPRTMLAVEGLLEHGARLWQYSTGTEQKSDPMARAMMAMTGAFAEMERAMISRRTREGHEVRARKGLVTGGACYGYKNVRGPDGVRHEVVEAEAGIIRDIFARRAAGASLRAIGHELNRLGVPSPSGRKRGTGSWSVTCLFEMLRRDRYRGLVEWGRMGTAYRGGTRVSVTRRDDEVLRVETPELRLVDDAVWEAVRRQDEPQRGTLGAPRRGRAPTRLLSGIARCGVCGGPMQSGNTMSGKQTIRSYRCAWAHDRGPTVCANKMHRPADEMEGAVLGWIRDVALAPGVITRVLHHLRELSQRTDDPATAVIERLESEHRRVTAEIGRLTVALASSDDPPEAIVRALGAREGALRTIATDLAAARAAAAPEALEWPQIEAAALGQLQNLRGLLDGQIDQARAALKELLLEPIVCEPKREERSTFYVLRSRVLLLRRVSHTTRRLFVTPTGFEPVLPT
jgi:site-specific DNA recombinase